MLGETATLGFATKGQAKGAGPAETADDERIYAIGDIHGCYDLLRGLLDKIAQHQASLPRPSRLRLVILGDFIDRGPASARVIQLLRSAGENTDALTVLLGNHEEMMLNALAGDAEAKHAWLRHGGEATLASFGLDPADVQSIEARAAAAMMREAVTQPVIDWLRTRPVMARSGDYVFCHAGLRPGVPIADQARDDLLWIRDDFLKADAPIERSVVVHGHSIAASVEQYPHRIGIDTGAYRTGILTAIYLEGSARAILSTADAD